MKIAVYDTFVTRLDGRVMHFDILVPAEGKELDTVLHHGRRYLATKGVPAESLTAQECRFCHLESATDVVQAAIDVDGFAVLELDNCD